MLYKLEAFMGTYYRPKAPRYYAPGAGDACGDAAVEEVEQRGQPEATPLQPGDEAVYKYWQSQQRGSVAAATGR